MPGTDHGAKARPAAQAQGLGEKGAAFWVWGVGTVMPGGQCGPGAPLESPVPGGWAPTLPPRPLQAAPLKVRGRQAAQCSDVGASGRGVHLWGPGDQGP